MKRFIPFILCIMSMLLCSVLAAALWREVRVMCEPFAIIPSLLFCGCAVFSAFAAIEEALRLR